MGLAGIAYFALLSKRFTRQVERGAARAGAVLTLALMALALTAAPAFASPVVINGYADSTFVTTAEDTPFELMLTASDATASHVPTISWLPWFPATGVTWSPEPSYQTGPNFTIYYTPPANYTTPGIELIQVFAYDVNQDGHWLNIFISVTPVEDVPVVTQGNIVVEQTDEDTPTSFTLNATDGDGDPLSWSVGSQPVIGTVTITSPNPSGVCDITYEPDADSHGSDPFEIQVSDGDDVTTVTVDMTVIQVNDPPVVLDEAEFTLEDGFVLGNLLVNDSDLEGDILSIAEFVTPGTWVSEVLGGGSLVSDTEGDIVVYPNGDYMFWPAPDWSGTYLMQYLVTDETDSSWAELSITVDAVEDDPFIDEGPSLSLETAEDTALLFDLNASDADPGTLFAWSTSPASNGVAEVDLTGATVGVTYTPAPSFAGFDTFDVTVDDGTGRTATITIDVTVQPVNEAPSFTAGSNVTVAEDSGAVTESSHATGISAGVGEGAQTLTFNVVNDNNGLFDVQPALDPAGDLTFTTKANMFGTAHVTVTLTDDDTYGVGTALTTDAQYFDIMITPVPDAPVAITDAYSVNEDGSLMVGMPGVLGNDTDAEGDPLIGVVDTYPTHGSLFFFSNGSFLYAPVADYHGADSFTYHANDGALNSASATVNITVNSVNDVPVIAEGASMVTSTPEDTEKLFTLTASDGDLDTIVWSISQAPVHGTASVTGGNVTYTPDADFFGNDYLTVRASDGNGGSASIEVQVEVTPANESLSPTYTISEDGSLLQFLGTTEPTVVTEPSHASDFELVTNWSRMWPALTAPLEPLSHFRYAPEADWYGSDLFVLSYPGGVQSTITIEVVPVNDAPRDLALSNASVSEAAAAGSAVGTVSATDPDSASISYTLVGGDTNAFELVGTQLRTRTALDYETRSAYAVKVRASDGVGASTDISFDIAVTNADDPPVVVGESYTVAEETQLTGDVTSNDYDLDSSPITWMLNQGPSHAASFSFTNGVFSYTPESDFVGTDTFTYHVISGSSSVDGTVVITVTNVNDAPVIAADADAVATEDTTFMSTESVLANDSDPDGDALTALAGTAPAHGTFVLFPNGYYLYVPHADYSGLDSFTYRVFDGTDFSGYVTNTINVTPVNDAPDDIAISSASVDENSPVDTAVGTLSSSDADSSSFTYSIVGTTNAFKVVGDELVVRRLVDFEAEAAIDVTVKTNDGDGGIYTKLFTIDINDVDEAPIAGADTLNAVEDVALTVAAPGILGNDSDPEGAEVQASLVEGTSHGTLELAADGSLVYTPDADYCGDDSFTYEASDGSQTSAITTVTIHVAAVNDAPITEADEYSTDEDVALSVAAPGVFDNDSDIEGDQLVASTVVAPTHGTVAWGADGAFVYTPSRGWSGTDSFTYRVSDGALKSHASSVTIVVNSIDTEIHQISGQNRLLTAVKVSQTAFPEGADTVIIATAGNWPDALGGSALAGAVDAPILLTQPDALSPDVLAEITRLGATKAYVLGAQAAVSDDVYDALDAALTGDVVRLGGANRYATSELVAAEAVAISGGADGVAFLAKGTNYPDALAASPLAAFKKWPIYLSTDEGVSDSTKAAMLQAGIEQVIVLGSDAAITQAAEAELVALGFDTERVSGYDRYATSVSIANYSARMGLSWNGLAMATGQNFPDGLSGGVLAAKRGAVMLLNPRDTLHPAVHDAIADNHDVTNDVYYLGDVGAISQKVRDDISALLR